MGGMQNLPCLEWVGGYGYTSTENFINKRCHSQRYVLWPKGYVYEKVNELILLFSENPDLNCQCYEADCFYLQNNDNYKLLF